ncbi:MAG TPA: SGNH/GDSL hydrolase family protein [Segeticoccus sp.]|nr:SGNH/GDSL hydrolase family protein [Segeticoccus sp.]
MGRARRARRAAAKAAFGGGIGAAGAGALGLLGYGVLRVEAHLARRVVGTPFASAPDDDGRYGHGPGPARQLVVLGDSSAAGLGADQPHQTMGATIAAGVAALGGRPVELTNAAVVGARSPDLDEQVRQALEQVARPDVAVILIGANDVTHRLDRTLAVRHLVEAVRVLRDAGVEVVVGTCPDLGTIKPIAQPLRLIAQRWSRDLAAAQTVGVVEAGGRTVSLGDMLGPEFAERPRELFSADRFHPSAAGYARAASAMLPSVCDALGLPSIDTGRAPDRRRGERVGPVSKTAVRAVRDPGTEVTATDVEGSGRGHRGRWAVLLRRHRGELPEEDVERDAAALADEADLVEDERRAAAIGEQAVEEAGGSRPGDRAGADAT